MKAWRIFPETIKQFERDNLISESVPPLVRAFGLRAKDLKKDKSL